MDGRSASLDTARSWTNRPDVTRVRQSSVGTFASWPTLSSLRTPSLQAPVDSAACREARRSAKVDYVWADAVLHERNNMLREEARTKKQAVDQFMLAASASVQVLFPAFSVRRSHGSKAAEPQSVDRHPCFTGRSHAGPNGSGACGKLRALCSSWGWPKSCNVEITIRRFLTWLAINHEEIYRVCVDHPTYIHVRK